MKEKRKRPLSTGEILLAKIEVNGLDYEKRIKRIISKFQIGKRFAISTNNFPLLLASVICVSFIRVINRIRLE